MQASREVGRHKTDFACVVGALAEAVSQGGGLHGDVLDGVAEGFACSMVFILRIETYQTSFNTTRTASPEARQSPRGVVPAPDRLNAQT
jgi:hypothetical protein